jgi:SAM-dependent methyltransferase
MNHKCKICLSPTHKDKDKKGRLYHFCGSCGFISLDPLFYLSESEEKERYELHNNSSDNKGYVQWLRNFLEIAVLPNLKGSDKILDFGSGPQPVMKELLEGEGFHVDIYDKYFHSESLSGTYDMIISTEVFEHLKDPLSVFLQLKERLNPRGFLVLKTSFRPESDSDFLRWWYKEDSTHIGFFSRKTFAYISEYSELNVYYTDDDSIVIFRN